MAIFTNYYGQNIPYYIGEVYKYESGAEIKLKAIDKRMHRFMFDKNHWCTDNVFMDLTRVKTNVCVYDTVTKQLELF